MELVCVMAFLFSAIQQGRLGKEGFRFQSEGPGRAESGVRPVVIRAKLVGSDKESRDRAALVSLWVAGSRQGR